MRLVRHFTKNEIKSFEKYDGNPDNFTINDYCNANNDKLYPIREICNKLGQLEDILQNHNIETLEELDGLLWYVKQIKNIEEELGIDLITLFKALRNGVWIKIFPKLKNGGSVIHVPCGLAIVEIGGGVGKTFGLEFYINTKRRYLVLDTRRDNDLKDYGKTWALTKEELEND